MNLNGGVSRSFERHAMPFVTGPGGENVQCTRRFQQDRSFSIPPSEQMDQTNSFHFSSRETEFLRLESIRSPTISDPTVHELSNMLLSLKHCTLKTNKTNSRRDKGSSSTVTNVKSPSNLLYVPCQQKQIDSVESISAFVTSSKLKREKRYTKVSHLSKQELYRKLHDRYMNLNKELSCTRIKMRKARALSSLSEDSIRSGTRTRYGSGADIPQKLDSSLKNPQPHHHFRQRERLHYFQKYQKKNQVPQELNFLSKRKRIDSLSSRSKLMYSSSSSPSPDIDHLSLSRIESSAQRMNYANPSSRRTSGNTHLFQPSQIGRYGQSRSGDDFSLDEKQKRRRIILDAIRVLQNDTNI